MRLQVRPENITFDVYFPDAFAWLSETSICESSVSDWCVEPELRVNLYRMHEQTKYCIRELNKFCDLLCSCQKYNQNATSMSKLVYRMMHCAFTQACHTRKRENVALTWWIIVRTSRIDVIPVCADSIWFPAESCFSCQKADISLQN